MRYINDTDKMTVTICQGILSPLGGNLNMNTLTICEVTSNGKNIRVI